VGEYKFTAQSIEATKPLLKPEELPNDLAAAVEQGSRFTQAHQELLELKAQAQAAVNAAALKFASAIRAKKEKIYRLEHGIGAFALPNWESAAGSGKTLDLGPTCRLTRRKSPPSLTVEDKDLAVRTLRELGLEKYLHTESVTNIVVTAIKKDSETINKVPGMELVEGEEVWEIHPIDLMEKIKAGAELALSEDAETEPAPEVVPASEQKPTPKKAKKKAEAQEGEKELASAGPNKPR
jgi:phage host-nuclease inhibitor protein Gam